MERSAPAPAPTNGKAHRGSPGPGEQALDPHSVGYGRGLGLIPAMKWVEPEYNGIQSDRTHGRRGRLRGTLKKKVVRKPQVRSNKYGAAEGTVDDAEVDRVGATSSLAHQLELERKPLPPAEPADRPDFTGCWKCVSVEGSWDTYLRATGVNRLHRKLAAGTTYGKDRALQIISQRGTEEITVTNATMLESWHETFKRGPRQPSVTTQIYDTDESPEQVLPAMAKIVRPPKMHLLFGRVPPPVSQESVSEDSGRPPRPSSAPSESSDGSTDEEQLPAPDEAAATASEVGGSCSSSTRPDGMCASVGELDDESHATTPSQLPPVPRSGAHGWLRRSRLAKRTIAHAPPLPAIRTGPPGLPVTIGWEGKAIVCRYHVGEGAQKQPIIMRRIMVDPPLHPETSRPIGKPQMVTRLIGESFFASRTFALVDDRGDLLY